LDSPAALSLPGTEGAGDPFWSPDSRSLGFFAGGKLKTIQVEGGAPVVVANASVNEAGGSWSRDGSLLFVPDFGKGIYKVAATGGEPMPVIRPDPHKWEYFASPRYLPDGRHFLFMSLQGDRGPGTYFASVDGEAQRFVVAGRTSAIYASGQLLYLRDGILVAQAFDADGGTLKGQQAYHIAENIPRAYVRGVFDASENGVRIYRTNRGANDKKLVWFDRNGKNLGPTGVAGDYFDVRLSPDGQKLASNAGTPYSEIWVDDLVHPVRRRLTIDPDTDHGMPVWSPDGSQIAILQRGPHVQAGIYRRPSNGAGDAALALAQDDKTSLWPTSWSPDGRFILYSRTSGPDTAIWVLPAGGDRRPHLLVPAQVRAYDGQFSPDGRWVAYTSEQSGTAEVYVAPFDGSRVLTAGSDPIESDRAGRWLVSKGGGRCPRWRKDGREIFYLSPASQMMAVKVEEEGDGIAVQTAQALFTCSISIPAFRFSAAYDVSPDGSRFVINTFSDESTPLILRVNWTADLNRR
jgi:dipeptidyl aminopeptidase/acylaminoacyl peptidase